MQGLHHRPEEKRNFVIEQEVVIPTAEGTPEGFLYIPEGAGPWPGVIHLTDIGGIRPSNRGMAQQLAAEGYTVLVPNVFYRTGSPPLIDFPIKPGEERSMKRLAELSGPLTPEAMARDASSYVDFLAAEGSVKPGGMGVVGYCFTGAMALRTAAARADKIVAAASFHGGRLFVEGPASPHLLLSRITARLYFGHASNDRGMPEAAIEGLNRALAEWGGTYESELYEGAGHGWTVPDSPVFNPPQAERAFAKLRQLFAQTLAK